RFRSAQWRARCERDGRRFDRPQRRPGQRSHFYARTPLPAKNKTPMNTNPDPLTPANLPKAPDQSVREHRRILIVDDTRAIHDDFRKILESGESAALDATE